MRENKITHHPPRPAPPRCSFPHPGHGAAGPALSQICPHLPRGLPYITWREGSGRDLVLKFSCSPERHVLGLRTRAALASAHQCHPLPRTLSVLKSTPQVRGMHTIIRDKETSRDEFIFYSKRLMRLLIEHALSFLPFQDCVVQTPQGQDYAGKCYAGKQITGVSILRAGETMEPALRAVCKDVRIGTILIQTNQLTGEPELHYLRLPKDISDDHVILMDCTVSTGAAAMMAVRVLLDHDVPEDKIFLLSLLMAEMGVHSVAYAFPRVRIITTAVDKRVNDLFRIIPGIGNFGDRYFGTDAAPDGSDEEEVASTS
ncbi:uridine-cytidine kinase-like 1 [Leptonychotes weddellii]|uniref:uridine/cytidine kinase n=1 Tax=Leptonychotes weddellii TaxID=9713 RepID=A0A7F8Q6P4_LEPWE|nr:uridine-cytidine kinase-like 1 [Leptonychotes weddellii]